jgi:phospho-N-acetylmuramoyl-pentapeptide-transferase
MIYNFLYPLADLFGPFNLFRYLTFQSIAAFLTALVLELPDRRLLVRWLRSKQAQGPADRRGWPREATSSARRGTPTMGWLLIRLITLSVATLLCR